ncbi:hypothetical protein G8759_21400 [Spirosoma aureum]|uniref:Uncharacterized protein n=1 Tax=Spirosoma aureum TaxID=2692134 RepID=A0A6G9AR92_9BACT|nr:hypothetical protein [Spirosoma aureum]QIP14997.1 hypothetical protein G8759_21400 [Spirosoma aureum]
MNRTAAYLAGPELSWLILYLMTMWLVAFYQPLATDSSKEQLLNFGWFLPLIGVIMAFVPLFWAPGNHWLWLIRIGLVSSLGIAFVVTYLCSSVQYHDSRDSGVGTAWIMFFSLGIMTLIGMMFISAIFLLTKWPLLPVLKWLLIIVGILIALGAAINWLASLDTGKAS